MTSGEKGNYINSRKARWTLPTSTIIIDLVLPLRSITLVNCIGGTIKTSMYILMHSIGHFFEKRNIYLFPLQTRFITRRLGQEYQYVDPTIVLRYKQKCTPAAVQTKNVPGQATRGTNQKCTPDTYGLKNVEMKTLVSKFSVACHHLSGK
jgi:hypothetical protein